MFFAPAARCAPAAQSRAPSTEPWPPGEPYYAKRRERQRQPKKQMLRRWERSSGTGRETRAHSFFRLHFRALGSQAASFDFRQFLWTNIGRSI